MENIVIRGSGGHAREVAFLIERINQVKPTWNLLGYIDLHDEGEMKYGYKVLGDDSWFLKHNDVKYCVIAIGNPNDKMKVYNELEKYSLIYPNIIDNQAIIAKDVKLGAGNVIQGTAKLSVGVKIGSFCLTNGVCSLGHDVVIGDFVSIMPFTAVSGNVMIGTGTFIGMGAKLAQGITVGRNVTICACSLVLDNIEDGIRVLGIPAKKT